MGQHDAAGEEVARVGVQGVYELLPHSVEGGDEARAERFDEGAEFRHLLHDLSGGSLEACGGVRPQGAELAFLVLAEQ